MSRDRRDELAGELFRAARAERPEPGLAERILSRSESAGAQGDLLLDAIDVPIPVERERSSRPFVRWLLAAATLALPIAFVVSKVARSSDPPTLTAEPLASNSTGTVRPLPRRSPVASEQVAPVEPAPDALVAERSGPPPALPRKAVSAKRVPAPPPASATSSSASSSSPAPNAAPSARPSLSNEIETLKGARSALRAGDGATALAILDRYDRESHANGLQAEGTLLRIEALAASSRRAEAGALARSFIAANPNSPLAERARAFLEQPHEP